MFSSKAQNASIRSSAMHRSRMPIYNAERSQSALAKSVCSSRTRPTRREPADEAYKQRANERPAVSKETAGRALYKIGRASCRERGQVSGGGTCRKDKGERRTERKRRI